ncbi:hypothetical protein N2152v2_001324 [Parachlorella kessleri]
MWSAYEELCTLGADTETQQYVGTTSAAGGAPAIGAAVAAASAPVRLFGPGASAAAVAPTPSLEAGISGSTATPNMQQGGGVATPAIGAKGGLGQVFGWMEGMKGPRGVPSSGQAASTTAPMTAPQRKFMDEGKLRKVSNKLFAEPVSILRQAEGEEQIAAGREADGAAVMDIGAVQGMVRGERSPEGHQAALELLRALAEGYRLLCLYRCQEAVEAFGRLPVRHYNTGWVLNQVGRALFELVDYPEAARSFQAARQLDPYRLKGLELYSTVMWHMKREVELSHLAQEAVQLDRQSPYAWCVMGNCFSLQKEHETALRYFQRALQLDPTLPYAYTLCGHEYFANEDFDKGITCYRNAIRIDPRHYNAWFGMGHIYYRQEKYGMAEYHFRRALNINSRSSVLRCYLGMALHKLKRNGEALDMLQEAIEADPRNPLAKFERASVLLSEDRYREALDELSALKDIAPREASVLFQMGKIYKRLDQVEAAMTCFCSALDLQPPSADTNLIKSAIERISVADEEEEEEI